MTKIEGNIIDVVHGIVFSGKIEIENGKIADIKETTKESSRYILPGLVDSHIHIESSMLCPSRFAEIAVRHGTVAVVADPHEIANVLGIKGIEYMIDDARQSPMKFYFAAPSCVPATKFETTGGRIGIKEIEKLLEREEIVALGEVMNFVGVIED